MLAKLFQEFHPMGSVQKHAVAETASSNAKRTRATYHGCGYMRLRRTEVDEDALGGVGKYNIGARLERCRSLSSRERRPSLNRPTAAVEMTNRSLDPFDLLARYREEVRWHDLSQVGILGDFLCPLASPHREISSSSRLQTPDDPSQKPLQSSNY